jgi:TonB-dependent Receptor Plug Domain
MPISDSRFKTKITPGPLYPQHLLALASLLSYAISAQSQVDPRPDEASSLLNAVNVSGRRLSDDSALANAPGAIGQVTTLKAEDIAASASSSIEELLQRNSLASIDAGSSFGLATGVSGRGFGIKGLSGASGKILLNGHPDIAYAFNRDLSTVETLTWTGGFDATLVGGGAPGGQLAYQSKRPRGTPFASFEATFSSDGLRRFSLDAEQHFGPLKVRAVLADQRGQSTVEGMPTDRSSFLVSSLLASPIGQFQLDLEQQHNRAPFVFGTVYAANRFWYDRPYVSPQSTADRSYSRTALYWNTELGKNTDIRLWVQEARVQRNETLVGFWTVEDDSTLSGYYRQLRASASQQDLGLQVRHLLTLGTTEHSLTVLAQRQTQSQEFSGPQSIARFSIDIADPIWPTNLAALTLRPRLYRELFTESGFALADSVQWNDHLELRAGLRHSRIALASANSAAIPAAVGQANHNTLSLGVTWKVDAFQKLWLSRIESFEHVAGQRSNGAFLPPQLGLQWELGWRRESANDKVSVSLFNITQSNIPGVDPLDRDYLVPIGTVRSQGASVQASVKWLGLQWAANTSVQHVRVVTPADTSQGPQLPGVPAVFGSLRVSTQETKQGLQAWVNPSWSARKPADANGSVYAPGYVRWDSGLVYKQTGWQINLSALNLFDLRYVQALNATDNVWQGPRRRVNIGLRFDL